MNTEVQNKSLGITSKRVIGISLVTFTLLMLAITAQLSYSMLVYDKVYKGVYINNIPVGGMSAAAIEEVLKKEHDDRIEKTDIVFSIDNVTQKISLKEINASYDVTAAINKALSVGRTGNILDRLSEISKISKDTLQLSVSVTYDGEKLDNEISKIYEKTRIQAQDPKLIIEDNRVVIRSGQKGKSVDKSKLLDEAENAIKTAKDDIIELSSTEIYPAKINVDEYYNLINEEAKDATATVVNNTVVFNPPVAGRSIDKSILTALVAEIEKTENTEKVLPVTLTTAKLSIDDIKSKVFKDTLAMMNTQFYTTTENDANRGENIKLAVSKIDGKILAPGETFSFNKIVGPRTEKEGYKVAHVYSDGKIIDDVGGGICQVSTTLYNAALFSDLDIVERINHMFTVGYVPKGQDAAVAYDYVDFKFKNSTQWPVQIHGWVTSDNRVFFSLKGTSENPERSIEIRNDIVKTLDFTTKYMDDPNMAEGESYVKTYGMTGYLVDTYKIIKQNGNIISESKMYTSVYNPLNQEVVKGTKKVKEE